MSATDGFVVVDKAGAMTSHDVVAVGAGSAAVQGPNGLQVVQGISHKPGDLQIVT